MAYATERTHADPDGLGIWGQVAVFVGTTLAPKIGGWISGGDEDVPNDVYYSQAKLGVIYCAGPWDVAILREALDNNPGDPIQGQITEYFRTGVSQRDADKWARYGVPRTAMEKAGALVAEAHGGSDCQGGPESTEASALVARAIELERTRRQTAPTYVEQVTGIFTGTPEVQPAATTTTTDPATGQTVAAVVTTSGETVPVTQAVVTPTGQIVKRPASSLPVIIPGVDTKWILGGAGALAVLLLFRK